MSRLRRSAVAPVTYVLLSALLWTLEFLKVREVSRASLALLVLSCTRLAVVVGRRQKIRAELLLCVSKRQKSNDRAENVLRYVSAGSIDALRCCFLRFLYTLFLSLSSVGY